MTPVLTVENLSVTFASPSGPLPAVESVSFALAPGETLAIVGESSSGKSVTALALMRLLGPPPACTVRGQATLHRPGAPPLDLLALPEPQMAALRGRDIGMVFQEPMTSLNPVHRIGAQIGEGLRAHERLSHAAATARAVELLDRVGIPEPALRARAYPHELSGGMRQRAMIAMALACRPRILIADEPTTALDVTIQAQVLDLIATLQAETGMAVIFITHNLGVVAEIADRVLVMYAGQVVEDAPVQTLLRRPLMPYSASLLASVPQLRHVQLRHVQLRHVQLGQAQARTEGGRLGSIPGNVPAPGDRPPGCVFHPRCQHAQPIPCQSARPQPELAAPGHTVRCARWREIAA